MFHLLLVRHSQSEMIQGIPASQWHLSQEGIRRAGLLGAQLSAYDFHQIISSTEPKAFETAQIIASNLGITTEIIPGLHEHVRQDVSFSNQQEFVVAIEQFFTHPGESVMGKETADQAYDRFSQAVSVVLNSYPSQDLAIVSHGTVISLFVSRRCGIPPFEFWQRLGLPGWVTLSLPEMRSVPVLFSVS
jgi:broad specificity phosphatase PhoE